MKVRAAVATLVAVAAVASLGAQSATTSAPGAYRTQFENAWVRLVRVSYGPNERVPVHEHPRSVTTYIYLNASGPVRFKHVGESNRVATRQPTTPGSFRVSRGGDEVHEVENTTAAPSDFLRLEFKTDDSGNRSPYFRDARRLEGARDTVSDVRFTNAQMRITRVSIAPGKNVEIVTPAAQPALLVALDAAMLSVEGAANAPLSMAIGQERWVEAARTARFANPGSASVEILRIDFLSAPR